MTSEIMMVMEMEMKARKGSGEKERVRRYICELSSNKNLLFDHSFCHLPQDGVWNTGNFLSILYLILKKFKLHLYILFYLDLKNYFVRVEKGWMIISILCR